MRGALTVYVEVVRGTPVLLQLFVLYYGLSSVVRLPAFAAAVLGLGLNYAAYESEIYRAALEAIARPQLEAARTLGLSEFQILRLVRGPQAFRLALAPMTNDFVALLKDSSLVSVITVVELTKQTAIYATNVGSWVVPGMSVRGDLSRALAAALARRAVSRASMERLVTNTLTVRDLHVKRGGEAHPARSRHRCGAGRDLRADGRVGRRQVDGASRGRRATAVRFWQRDGR